MDEQVYVSGESPVQKIQSASPTDDICSMLDALYAHPEVCGAVVTKPKGHMRISKSYQEKKSGGMSDAFLLNLASDGEYLFLVGRQIGHLLNLGDPQRAACLSNEQTILSVRTDDVAVHVAFCPGVPLESARKMLHSTLKSPGKDQT